MQQRTSLIVLDLPLTYYSSDISNDYHQKSANEKTDFFANKIDAICRHLSGRLVFIWAENAITGSGRSIISKEEEDYFNKKMHALRQKYPKRIAIFGGTVCVVEPVISLEQLYQIRVRPNKLFKLKNYSRRFKEQMQRARFDFVTDEKGDEKKSYQSLANRCSIFMPLANPAMTLQEAPALLREKSVMSSQEYADVTTKSADVRFFHHGSLNTRFSLWNSVVDTRICIENDFDLAANILKDDLLVYMSDSNNFTINKMFSAKFIVHADSIAPPKLVCTQKDTPCPYQLYKLDVLNPDAILEGPFDAFYPVEFDIINLLKRTINQLDKLFKKMKSLINDPLQMQKFKLLIERHPLLKNNRAKLMEGALETPSETFAKVLETLLATLRMLKILKKDFINHINEARNLGAFICLAVGLFNCKKREFDDLSKFAEFLTVMRRWRENIAGRLDKTAYHYQLSRDVFDIVVNFAKLERRTVINDHKLPRPKPNGIPLPEAKHVGSFQLR
jgi:hypothetical protein